MILHGVIAFLGVARFWINYLKKGVLHESRWVEFRRIQLLAEVSIALQVLEQNSKLSDTGTCLIKGLREEHSKLQPHVNQKVYKKIVNQTQLRRKNYEKSLVTHFTQVVQVQEMSSGVSSDHIHKLLEPLKNHKFWAKVPTVNSWETAQILSRLLLRIKEEKPEVFEQTIQNISKIEPLQLRDYPQLIVIFATIAYLSHKFQLASEFYILGIRCRIIEDVCWRGLGFSLRHQGDISTADLILFNYPSLRHKIPSSLTRFDQPRDFLKWVNEQIIH